jgi:hypothetical protein
MVRLLVCLNKLDSLKISFWSGMSTCFANKKGIVILYLFFRLVLFFLLVVRRFFPVPVFLFVVAFDFCDGFALALTLGFAGLLVGDSSLLVVLIGPGGVEDSDIF